jgi:hypothetical protein
MMIGDGGDGSGSDLLNGITRNLPERTECNDDVGLDHVTPSKLLTMCQIFSVHAIK